MFGNRLKLLRKGRGLTQKDLSGILGVSQGHISALEKNEKAPGSDILISIKQFFDVDLNWLLVGDGDEPDSEEIKQVALDPNPEIADLLEGARKVLTSGNPIAFDALERNIRYFSHSLEVEKRLQEMEAKLAEMDELKRYVLELKKQEEEREKADLRGHISKKTAA